MAGVAFVRLVPCHWKVGLALLAFGLALIVILRYYHNASVRKIKELKVPAG